MGEIERRNEVAVKERKHVISLKFKERKNDLSQFTRSKTDEIEKKKKKNAPFSAGAFGAAVPFICDLALRLLCTAGAVRSFFSLASLRHAALLWHGLRKTPLRKGGISKQKAIKEVASAAAGGI